MQPQVTDLERRVLLQNAYNVRELGGYKAESGTLRRGQVYRADSLHRLTHEEQELLRARGLRTVIDLRRDDEVHSAPNVFRADPSMQYLHISLFVTRPSRGANDGAFPASLTDIYRYILDTSQAPLHLVLSSIMSSPGPVLFHCTAGKDRTGLIAALLLDLAGVAPSDIINDYALTEAYIAPLLPELREARPAMMPLEMYDRLLEAKPEFMRDTLNYLHNAYGGAAGYLRALGWRDTDLEQMRRFLVEPG